MLLSGFLVLPTTFDKDPQLRMSSGVITIAIVALLTGGYSLTALIWFACPSIVFRQEYIFIPAASSSIFGFLGTSWALTISPRYEISSPSCPITIVLTLVSAMIYGGFAIHTNRRIKEITLLPAWPSHPSAHDSEYYAPYASSTYPLVARSVASEQASLHSNTAQLVLSEEEMVNQQMATLLTKADPRPSPDATQGTFRLEWPGGADDDEDPTGRSRSRTGTFTANKQYLTAGDGPQHSRSNSEGVAGALSKFGRAIGFGDRGRLQVREEALRAERRKSREDRRREIELGHL